MGLFDNLFSTPTASVGQTANSTPAFSLAPAPLSAGSSALGGNVGTSAPLNLAGLFGPNSGLQINSMGSTPLPHPAAPAVAAPAPSSTYTPPVPTSPSSLAGYPSANTASYNFSSNTGTSPTVPSSQLSPGALQDLLDARNAKQAAMMKGTNLDGSDATGLIPSDTLQGQIANQLYQSKLYTPEEQSLISNGQDLVAQTNAAKLAERRQVTQLVEDGTITKEQGASFVSEAERRANQNLADLSVAQDSNTARLTALGLIRNNSTTALQTLMDTLKGTTVAPGSTVYNPITGTQYQGTGASPVQVASYAQQLEQSALTQGTVQYAPDGSIDHSFYYNLATSQLSPGGAGTGTGTGASTGGQTGAGAQTALQPGTPAFFNALPNTVAPAYRTLPSGESYFDGSKLDASGLGTARAISKQTGVPILDSEEVASLQDLTSVQNGLNTTKSYFDQLAPNGVLGKLTDTVTNPASKLFGTTYGNLLTAYQNNKDNLFRQISAFAGSHPRLNTTEIVTQANALPVVGNNPFTIDTLKQGQAKLDLLEKSINNIKASILPNQTGQYTAPTNSVGGAAGGNPFAPENFY